MKLNKIFGTMMLMNSSAQTERRGGRKVENAPKATSPPKDGRKKTSTNACRENGDSETGDTEEEVVFSDGQVENKVERIGKIERCCDLCEVLQITDQLEETVATNKRPPIISFNRKNQKNTGKKSRSSVIVEEVEDKGSCKKNTGTEKHRFFRTVRWTGFREDFPGKGRGSTSYRMSGLLDLKTDMHVLFGDDSNPGSDVGYISEDPSPEQVDRDIIEISPHSPFSEPPSPRYNDVGNQTPEDLTEDHRFPCSCPLRCTGKLSPVWKKDQRMWLWKSRERKEEIMRDFS